MKVAKKILFWLIVLGVIVLMLNNIFDVSPSFAILMISWPWLLLSPKTPSTKNHGKINVGDMI